MFGCLVLWRFGDLLIIWLFDIFVDLLCFVLFCLVLFVASLQLDRKACIEKLLWSETLLKFDSRKRLRHSHNAPSPNAVV